ncbi:MAG TPA: ABC transporter permease [Parafilimonas sp.]|nr:ABC transporter permease [Parafilimonas sp.]
MFNNYFKTAWRNLLRNKTFSAINVLGLGIGIAAFLLIVNYLRFEYSFDDFNTNKDRMYRVPMTVTETDGNPQTFAFTYPAVAPAMKKDFPEVQEVVRFRRRSGIVQHGDQKIIEGGTIYFVDPAVFKVFSFKFEKGSAATAFAQLNDAVITHSTAIKYFGNEDPIGKTLHYNDEDYVVTALLKDVPANSHLQFHILLNYNKYIQLTNGDANTSWGWSDFYTYLLLRPGANAHALQSKMPVFAQRYMGDDMKKNGYTVSFEIQPLKDIHTRSRYDYEMAGSGDLYYLKYLGIAALFILLIALINYINLSTAHSLERSKEVGVRKVIGATKMQLVRQFLAETFLMNAFGIIIGFVLFKLALSQFSLLIGQNVTDLQTATWQFWVVMLIVFVSSTLLAGFYPAFILSSFQPVQSLKSIAGFGTARQSRNFFRKSLVVVQFTAAIILIGGAIGFYRQLQFMSTRDLGVNIKQTLVLQQTANVDSGKIPSVQSFLNDLQSIPGVQAISSSTDVPGSEVGSSTDFRVMSSNEGKRCRIFGIDEKFIPNYGLSLAAGRNFDKDKPASSDTNQVLSLIVNETAAKIFGFNSAQDAIGKMLHGAGYDCTIVGVLHDYHQQSLQYNYDPIVFYPEQEINMSSYSLKLNTSNLQQVIAQVKQVWNKRFPASPFTFFFLDEHFNEQYRNDQLFSTILWLFTLLAIIIASLGLFGLSLYTVAKRTKEISLRKVLGATVLQITGLITKDYVKLIVYAGLIAIPLAYFLLQNWLNDYAFHISIGLWFFVLPFLLILVIAMSTVLYQSIRAALTNPVKNLRNE